MSSANPGKSTRTRCSHCAGRRTDVRDSPQSWLPGQYLVEHIESTAIYPAFHQCALGNEERRYPLLSPGSVRSVADGGPASGSSPEGSRIPAARSTTPAPRRFGLLLVISPNTCACSCPKVQPDRGEQATAGCKAEPMCHNPKTTEVIPRAGRTGSTRDAIASRTPRKATSSHGPVPRKISAGCVPEAGPSPAHRPGIFRHDPKRRDSQRRAVACDDHHEGCSTPPDPPARLNGASQVLPTLCWVRPRLRGCCGAVRRVYRAAVVVSGWARCWLERWGGGRMTVCRR